MKRAEHWSDKLKYIFYAPGWSHDGADKRAKILRKDLLSKDAKKYVVFIDFAFI